MSAEPIARGELVMWAAVHGGQKIHAFAHDPEATHFRMVSLCRAGLSASTGKSVVGVHCQDCERMLRFLVHTADKYNERGEARGRALALAEKSRA